MLDYFAIFTKGGALLWTLQFTAALKHNPIEALNALIRGCLLEERSADNAYTYTPKMGSQQSLKWTFDNRLGLVFVAVYQRALSLTYVDELLQCIKDEFAPVYHPGNYEYSSFRATFEQRLKECESRAAARRSALPSRTNSTTGASKANGAATKQAKGGAGGKQGQQRGSEEDGDEDGGSTPSDGTPAGATPDGSSSEGDGTRANGELAVDRSKLAKLGSRKDKGAGLRRPPSKRKEETQTEVKRGKVDRRWGGKLSAAEAEALDRSDKTQAAAAMAQPAYGTGMKSLMEEEEEDWGDDDEAQLETLINNSKGAATAAPAKRSVLGSFMSSLATRVMGKEALSEADLAPALEGMKRKLMERNVAEEIAGQICTSVAHSLEGKKLSSFTGVSKFVRDAFEEALSGILNKRQVDVLHAIQRQKARGRPYVIVFCGVNGVGKSTNLAKICYWLGQHGLKVQLAACDTFRAGAVEQLKTHAMRLGVPLYERGYEKDPAKVAAEAIAVAQRDGRDVVLVDTAGRMQDNEPLMRALANLIHVNHPNLVLFVGEALVGNDAVDQLVKFNRALYDLAPRTATEPHNIDGIVLTKFDTIDDKVGAAISMVYASGAPVMFVGCGQTYVDLKKLPVRSVVRSLLS